MKLEPYLRRIGFSGILRADLDTLCRLQRGHLENIPYENFDVQLGRRLTLDPNQAFAKMVEGGRGGWCYEMNGLFLWALQEIGFRVTPMTGAVMRAQRGESAVGNHLVLGVELDRAYLVDLGLGDGPVEPTPLQEGTFERKWGALRLERMPDGWWRFHNYKHSFASSFDFQSLPADWNVLAERCVWQQSSPESRFVQNAICQRHRPDSIIALVGRVMKTVDHGGTSLRLVNSAEEYVEILGSAFTLDLPQAAGLWPRIVARHEVLFGNTDPTAARAV